MAKDKTYTEDGREFYSDTNQPVWPRRHRQLNDMKSGKPKGSLRQDPVVRLMLDKLDELERKTRPGSDGSASEKDDAAFDALVSLAWLGDYVAGWAIDHQRGLALQGLRSVPWSPSQTRGNAPIWL